MAGNSQQFTLRFNADTAQAKKALNELNASLSKVSTVDLKVQVSDSALEKASDAAKELQKHLQAATNVDTGKLNLNDFSKSLTKANTSVEKLGNALLDAGTDGQQAFAQLASVIANAEVPIKRMNKTLQAWGQTLKNTVKWELSSTAVHGLESALSNAVGYARNLNTSLNNIRIVTGQSVEDMAKFAVQANRAAKELSTTTKAYTDAALIYYQQGDNPEEVAKKAAITIKAANAAFGASAQEMSEYLTAVWNSYQAGSDELEKYADIMASLGAKTATSLEEIATSMQKVAATANTVGVSMEQVSSIIATVSSVTRESAESIGTSFKTIFARMGDLKLGKTLEDGVGLGQVSETLGRIGVAVLDANGQMNDMGSIIENLMDKWQNLSRAEQTAVAQVVAGKRQYTQLFALMENKEMYDENMFIAQNSGGALNEMANTAAESWEKASQRVQAAWEKIFNSIINDQALVKMTQGIEKAVTALGGFIDGAGGLAGLAGTIGGALTHAFSKDIANGIVNIKNKVVDFFKGTNEQTRFLANSAKMREELTRISQDSSVLNAKQKEEINAALIVQEKKDALLKASSNLSADQVSQAQGILTSYQQQITALTQIIELEEKRQNFMDKEQTSVTESVLQKDAASRAHKEDQDYQYLNAKERQKYLQEAQEGFVADAASIDLKIQFKTEGSEEVQEKVQTIQEWGDELKQNFKGIDILGDNKNWSQTVQQATRFLQVTGDINNAYKQLENTFGKLEDGSSKLFASNRSETEIANDLKAYAETYREIVQEMDNDKMNKAFAKFAGLDPDIDPEELKKAIENVDFDKMLEGADKTKLEAFFLALEQGMAVAQAETSKAAPIVKNMVLQMIPDEGDRQKMAAFFDEVVKGTPRLEQLGDEAKKAAQKMEKAFEEATQKTTKKLEAFIDITGALESVYGLINSFQGALEVFNDPDASGWEKVGAAISLASTVAMTFMSVAQGINGVMTLFGITSWGVASGVTATGAASAGATGPVAAFGVALNTALGPIGWIALAITALVVGIVALSKAMSGGESASEKANKAFAGYSDALDAATSAAEHMKTTIRGIKDVLDDTSLSMSDQISKINELGAAYGIAVSAIDLLNSSYGNLQEQVRGQALATLLSSSETAYNAYESMLHTINDSAMYKDGMADADEYMYAYYGYGLNLNEGPGGNWRGYQVDDDGGGLLNIVASENDDGKSNNPTLSYSVLGDSSRFTDTLQQFFKDSGLYEEDGRTFKTDTQTLEFLTQYLPQWNANAGEDEEGNAIGKYEWVALEDADESLYDVWLAEIHGIGATAAEILQQRDADLQALIDNPEIFKSFEANGIKINTATGQTSFSDQKLNIIELNKILDSLLSGENEYGIQAQTDGYIKYLKDTFSYSNFKEPLQEADSKATAYRVLNNLLSGSDKNGNKFDFWSDNQSLLDINDRLNADGTLSKIDFADLTTIFEYIGGFSESANQVATEALALIDQGQRIKELGLNTAQKTLADNTTVDMELSEGQIYEALADSIDPVLQNGYTLNEILSVRPTAFEFVVDNNNIKMSIDESALEVVRKEADKAFYENKITSTQALIDGLESDYLTRDEYKTLSESDAFKNKDGSIDTEEIAKVAKMGKEQRDAYLQTLIEENQILSDSVDAGLLESYKKDLAALQGENGSIAQFKQRKHTIQAYTTNGVTRSFNGQLTDAALNQIITDFYANQAKYQQYTLVQGLSNIDFGSLSDEQKQQALAVFNEQTKQNISLAGFTESDYKRLFSNGDDGLAAQIKLAASGYESVINSLRGTVTEWELLQGAEADLKNRIAAMEDQQEAAEWWESTGKNLARSAEKTNKYADAMSKYGQMSATELQELQAQHGAEEDVNILTEYAKGQESWIDFTYDQLMQSYDKEIELNEGNLEKVKELEAEKKAMTAEYYQYKNDLATKAYQNEVATAQESLDKQTKITEALAGAIETGTLSMTQQQLLAEQELETEQTLLDLWNQKTTAADRLQVYNAQLLKQTQAQIDLNDKAKGKTKDEILASKKTEDQKMVTITTKVDDTEMTETVTEFEQSLYNAINTATDTEFMSFLQNSGLDYATQQIFTQIREESKGATLTVTNIWDAYAKKLGEIDSANNQVWANFEQTATQAILATVQAEQQAAQETVNAWLAAFNAIKEARQGLTEGKSLAEIFMGDPESLSVLIEQYLKSGNYTYDQVMNWVRSGATKTDLTYSALSIDELGKQQGLASVVNADGTVMSQEAWGEAMAERISTKASAFIATIASDEKAKESYNKWLTDRGYAEGDTSHIASYIADSEYGLKYVPAKQDDPNTKDVNEAAKATVTDGTKTAADLYRANFAQVVSQTANTETSKLTGYLTEAKTIYDQSYENESAKMDALVKVSEALASKDPNETIAAALGDSLPSVLSALGLTDAADLNSYTQASIATALAETSLDIGAGRTETKDQAAIEGSEAAFIKFLAENGILKEGSTAITEDSFTEAGKAIAGTVKETYATIQANSAEAANTVTQFDANKKVLESLAEKYDLSTDRIKAYSEALVKNGVITATTTDQQYESAAKLLNMQEGFNTITESADSWQETITSATANHETKTAAQDAMRAALRDIFQLNETAPISDTLLDTDTLELMKKAATGDSDAWTALLQEAQTAGTLKEVQALALADQNYQYKTPEDVTKLDSTEQSVEKAQRQLSLLQAEMSLLNNIDITSLPEEGTKAYDALTAALQRAGTTMADFKTKSKLEQMDAFATAQKENLDAQIEQQEALMTAYENQYDTDFSTASMETMVGKSKEEFEAYKSYLEAQDRIAELQGEKEQVDIDTQASKLTEVQNALSMVEARVEKAKNDAAKLSQSAQTMSKAIQTGELSNVDKLSLTSSQIADWNKLTTSVERAQMATKTWQEHAANVAKAGEDLTTVYGNAQKELKDTVWADDKKSEVPKNLQAYIDFLDKSTDMDASQLGAVAQAWQNLTSQGVDLSTLSVAELSTQIQAELTNMNQAVTDGATQAAAESKDNILEIYKSLGEQEAALAQQFVTAWEQAFKAIANLRSKILMGEDIAGDLTSDFASFMLQANNYEGGAKALYEDFRKGQVSVNKTDYGTAADYADRMRTAMGLDQFFVNGRLDREVAGRNLGLKRSDYKTTEEYYDVVEKAMDGKLRNLLANYDLTDSGFDSIDSLLASYYKEGYGGEAWKILNDAAADMSAGAEAFSKLTTEEQKIAEARNARDKDMQTYQEQAEQAQSFAGAANDALSYNRGDGVNVTDSLIAAGISLADFATAANEALNRDDITADNLDQLSDDDLNAIYTHQANAAEDFYGKVTAAADAFLAKFSGEGEFADYKGSEFEKEAKKTKDNSADTEANVKVGNTRQKWQRNEDQMNAWAEKAQMTRQEFEEFTEAMIESGEVTAKTTEGQYKQAASLARIKNGLKTVRDSMQNWQKQLKSTQGDAVAHNKVLSTMRRSFEDVLDVPTGALDDLSEGFMTSTETAEMLKGAMEGDNEQYNKLQAAVAQQILIGEGATVSPDLANAIATISSDLDTVLKDYVNKPITLGELAQISPNLYSALTSYVAAVAQAGGDVQAAAAALGFDVQPVTKTFPYTVEGPQYTPGTVFEDPATGITYQSVNTSVDSTAGTITVTAIKTITNKGSSGGNIGGSNPPPSGGGGGGGKKEPKKLDQKKPEKEKKRYYHLEEQLKRLAERYDELSAMKDRAFGKNYISNIDAEIDALQDEIAVQKQYIAAAKDYLETVDRPRLEALGGVFDEDGNLANYEAVMDGILAKYNDFIDRYNAASAEEQEEMAEEKEKMDEWYADQLEFIEQYAETLGIINEKENELLELQNKISEATLEKITYKVEIVTEINDKDVEILEYYQKLYEDNLDSQGKLMRNLTQQAQEYESNMAVITTAMAELKAEYNDGKGPLNEADFVEGMQKLQDQALSYANSLEDLKEQIIDVYSNTLDMAREEIQHYTDVLQESSDAMSTFISIMGLLGHGVDYRSLEKFYKAQYESNVLLLENQRKQLEELKKKERYFERQKALNGELTEVEQEQYKALQLAIRETNAELISSTEAALSALQEGYQNTISAIFKELDASIAGTAGTIAELADEYAYYQEEQERYVSTAKELYEVSKLNRSIEQSLQDATTSASKAKLKALQEEINLISEKNDLSEYDIEMMNLQYKLTLAQIALEEAQASKDTVRLTRDQDGNMAYQYTANQEKVHEAQQQYEDVLQEINDLGANRISELEQSYLTAQQDYIAAAAEIWADTQMSDEERTRRLTELSRRYSETLLYIQEQYTNASNALTINQQTISEHYGQALVNSMGYASTQLNSTLQQMIDNPEAYIQQLNETIFGTSMDALSQYLAGVQGITDAAGLVFDESGIMDILDAYTDANEEAAASANAAIDAMGDALTDVNAATQEWDAHLATLENVQNAYVGIAEAIQQTITAMSGFQEYFGSENNPANSNPEDTAVPEGSFARPPVTVEGLMLEETYLDAISEISDLASQIIEVQASAQVSDEQITELMNAYHGNLEQVLMDTTLTMEEREKRLAEVTEYYEAQLNELENLYTLQEELLESQNIWHEHPNWSTEEYDAIMGYINADIENFFSFQDNVLKAIGSVTAAIETQTMEQFVEIKADFPNVTNQDEIKEAFNELIILASQHANSSNGRISGQYAGGGGGHY